MNRELLHMSTKPHLLKILPSETVPFVTKANVPTAEGDFTVYAFSEHKTSQDHLAIVHGDIDARQRILVRVHSECWTGEVLGSLRCDCNQQLHLALKAISEKNGIVIYLRQEGRGIGLVNKLKAYGLQEQGLDTVEANLALGFPDDLRDYHAAVEILRFFGIQRISLMTNNPKKVLALKDSGIDVERIPHQSKMNSANLHYMRVKAAKSGHLLDFIEDAR